MNSKFFNPLVCFCFGSTDVEGAQRLANESNEKIAAQNNLYNVLMQQYQNQWNLDRRDEEWAYNDPSAQMERMIKAGINPNFAIGQLDNSPAQQLTSAEAKPAESWEFKPEYDPSHAESLGNIISASRDVVNAAQGFQSLALQAEDVATRRNAQLSRSSLDIASAAEKRASTTGKEIENKWNLSTFEVRANSEAQKLSNLKAQQSSLEAGTRESEAKRMEIEESTKLIREQTTSVMEGVKQRTRELDIMYRNSLTNAGQLDLQREGLEFNREKFVKEVNQWDNENILRYMEKFGKRFSVHGEASAKLGVSGFGVGASAGGSYQQLKPATVDEVIECGLILQGRYAENPSEENARAASNAAIIQQKVLDAYQRQINFGSFNFNSSQDTILNPSTP